MESIIEQPYSPNIGKIHEVFKVIGDTYFVLKEKNKMQCTSETQNAEVWDAGAPVLGFNPPLLCRESSSSSPLTNCRSQSAVGPKRCVVLRTFRVWHDEASNAKNKHCEKNSTMASFTASGMVFVRTIGIFFFKSASHVLATCQLQASFLAPPTILSLVC